MNAMYAEIFTKFVMHFSNMRSILASISANFLWCSPVCFPLIDIKSYFI